MCSASNILAIMILTVNSNLSKSNYSLQRLYTNFLKVSIPIEKFKDIVENNPQYLHIIEDSNFTGMSDTTDSPLMEDAPILSLTSTAENMQAQVKPIAELEKKVGRDRLQAEQKIEFRNF